MSKEMLKQSMLMAVENQLKSNNPPETTATLQRLMSEGYSRQAALELIASVLISEVFDVVESNEPYNENRYVSRLKQLPTLPFDEQT
ncbi:MAG: hypothetical protein HUU34_00250 [Saprospiraceae bacterium]|jgi:uncharacterized protein with ATP-grasp and redox domains|nr:hypothetical protein [Saprospiraceae bacterium]